MRGLINPRKSGANRSSRWVTPSRYVDTSGPIWHWLFRVSPYWAAIRSATLCEMSWFSSLSLLGGMRRRLVLGFTGVRSGDPSLVM